MSSVPKPKAAAPAPETKEQTTEAAAAPETSKEIIPVEERPAPAISTGHSIDPQTREELWWLAGRVINSGLAPKGCTTQDDAYLRMYFGRKIGLDEMDALQNIANINGRTSIWGDVAKALVIRSPLCLRFVEKPFGKQYDDTYGWECTVQRKGHDLITRRFTVADAKKAKKWGTDSPWSTYPDRMLQMRARGWAIRDEFPDVLKGLSIAEEAQDYIDVTATSVQLKPARSLEDLTNRLESETRPEAVDDDPPFDPETGEILEAEAAPVEAPKAAAAAAKPERAKAAGGDKELF